MLSLFFVLSLLIVVQSFILNSARPRNAISLIVSSFVITAEHKPDIDLSSARILTFIAIQFTRKRSITSDDDYISTNEIQQVQ